MAYTNWKMYSSTLSLHDALPISARGICSYKLQIPRFARNDISQIGALSDVRRSQARFRHRFSSVPPFGSDVPAEGRSEEHTSELQSRRDLVCRLLLEKKNRTDAT